MNKLLLTLLLMMLTTSTVAFGAGGSFDFTYSNTKGFNESLQSEDITCFEKEVKARNGSGTFNGVMVLASPTVSNGHGWTITLGLNGYDGVGIYSVQGGSQFKSSIMHFTKNYRYFSSKEKPGKVEVLSDDGNIIKGEFEVTAYHAGEMNNNPQIFKGKFTVSRN